MQPVLSQERPFVIMLDARLSFVLRDFLRGVYRQQGHVCLWVPPKLVPCALWTKG